MPLRLDSKDSDFAARFAAFADTRRAVASDVDQVVAYLDRADASFALAGEDAYRARVRAKRATLPSIAADQAARQRTTTAPSIGSGLSRTREQHPANEGRGSPVGR